MFRYVVGELYIVIHCWEELVIGCRLASVAERISPWPCIKFTTGVIYIGCDIYNFITPKFSLLSRVYGYAFA